MSGRRDKYVQEPGSWVMHRIAMKESPAWRAAPDNVRRLLDRLELEHMRHGGAENGRLVCTYDDLAKWGLRRASVALAIRQAVGLGFLEVTRAGYKSAAEFRVTSLYRLTYVFGRGRGRRDRQEPTDEWELIATDEKAAAKLAEAAARQPSRRRPSPPGNIDSRRDGAPDWPANADARARLGGGR
jgi:hypothetical protein